MPSGGRGASRVVKKVVEKRISAMGSSKNRRAAGVPGGEKRGRAASYRDKEKKFGKSARGFWPEKFFGANLKKNESAKKWP